MKNLITKTKEYFNEERRLSIEKNVGLWLAFASSIGMIYYQDNNNYVGMGFGAVGIITGCLANSYAEKKLYNLGN